MGNVHGFPVFTPGLAGLVLGEYRRLAGTERSGPEVPALTERETAGYIAGRIAVAGGTASQVFTREAVGIIHQAAHGLPRMVSVVADNALLGGFARSQKPVGSQIVREVCHDFDLGVVRAPSPVSPSTPIVTAPSQVPARSSGNVLFREQPAPRPTTNDLTQPGSLVTVPPAPDPGLLSLLSIKGKRFFSGS